MQDLLEMPAVVTDNLPSDIARYVEEAAKEIKEEDSVGLMYERYHGTVNVKQHPYPHPAGATPIMRHGNDVRADNIFLSKKLDPRYVDPRYIKRVAKHEMRHVRSERLLRYADVDETLARNIVESYAEYVGMINNKNGEKELILKTTPYKGAIKFAIKVDMYYVSDIDGKKGYRAFIRDIFKHKSMAKVIRTYQASLKIAQS